MATPTSPSAAAPNEASHMPPTRINPNNTSSPIPGLCGASPSDAGPVCPLGGGRWSRRSVRRDPKGQGEIPGAL
eukprot:4644081-Prymnesium_polylepis.1